MEQTWHLSSPRVPVDPVAISDRKTKTRRSRERVPRLKMPRLRISHKSSLQPLKSKSRRHRRSEHRSTLISSKRCTNASWIASRTTSWRLTSLLTGPRRSLNLSPNSKKRSRRSSTSRLGKTSTSGMTFSTVDRAFGPTPRDSRHFLTSSSRSWKTLRLSPWRSWHQWTLSASSNCRFASSSTQISRVRSRRGKLSNFSAPPSSRRITTFTCSMRRCLTRRGSCVPIWQTIFRSACQRWPRRSMSCERRALKKSSATKMSGRRSRRRLRSIANMRSITRNRWGLIKPRWGKSNRSSKAS